MPAGKIKESLWLGTARIFLSSLRGQGGVRQLDGALGGLWGLGRPPKPERPRVQVPAESNQGGGGERERSGSATAARSSIVLWLFSPRKLSCPTFSLFCCLLILDTHVKVHTSNMKP